MVLIIIAILSWVFFPIAIRKEYDRLFFLFAFSELTESQEKDFLALKDLIAFEKGIFTGETDLIGSVFYCIAFILFVPITFPIVVFVRIAKTIIKWIRKL